MRINQVIVKKRSKGFQARLNVPGAGRSIAAIPLGNLDDYGQLEQLIIKVRETHTPVQAFAAVRRV